MNDAVDCVLQADRCPQSGPLTAWDTMAVLMAGYESSENGGAFVDLGEPSCRREFSREEAPDPRATARVFQRM
jgi:hypothetical protein